MSDAILTPPASECKDRGHATIQSWLDDAERHVREAASDLGNVLSDHFGEARFGAAIIQPERARLPAGAKVLEIGAGMLLLGCALQAAGYQVTAVEPIGSGFSHLHRLREIVWAYSGGRGCRPRLVSQMAEEFTSRPCRAD